MAQFFFSRQKSFFLILAVILILVFVLVIWASKPAVRQPIAFNHKKHIENNVPCQFCHRYYEKSTIAGIPGVKICVTCHEPVIYVTREKAKILKYYQNKQQIPWKRIYRIADHVFFSHRLHVKVAKIDCQRCHGPVSQMDRPITKQYWQIRMNNCIECHKKVRSIQNPYECIRCHR